MKSTDLWQKGNLKVPSTTWVVNSGSAAKCPARVLGLCQAGKDCYALKSECMYTHVLLYRERQALLYRSADPVAFADSMLAQSGRARKASRKMTTFRYNEAGDFEDQSQLDWFVAVCRRLAEFGVACYGYTARTDLDLTKLQEVSQVNVSNDLGGWQSRGANRFRIVRKGDEEPKVMCPGNCRKCNLCITGRGIEAGIAVH